MAQRGRKSTASLAVITPIKERPQPPADLFEDAADEWRRVMATREPDYFGQEQLAHLTAYCTHVATAQLLTREIEALPRPVNAAQRSKLLRDRRDEMKLALDIGRSLRLTLHSQRTAQTAGTASRAAVSAKRLWEI
jgi:phage terminase small subunit